MLEVASKNELSGF